MNTCIKMTNAEDFRVVITWYATDERGFHSRGAFVPPLCLSIHFSSGGTAIVTNTRVWRDTRMHEWMNGDKCRNICSWSSVNWWATCDPVSMSKPRWFRTTCCCLNDWTAKRVQSFGAIFSVTGGGIYIHRVPAGITVNRRKLRRRGRRAVNYRTVVRWSFSITNHMEGCQFGGRIILDHWCSSN